MPRTYKRKTHDTYTQNDLEQALSDIREKNLPVKAVAAQYQIPTRTLHYRLSGSRTDAGRGSKTTLTKDEESLLVHTIHLFQQWQCPMSPSDVISLAKPYMVQLGKKVSSECTLRDWFHGFMRRWSNEIKLAKTVKLEKARSKACRKETIDCWFKHLQEVLTKHNLYDRPEAIWNADESGFCDDPGRRSVVVKRDSKYAISSQSGTGKSFTTVLMCTSASGEKLPPYIIHRGRKLWSTWIPKNGFPGTRYNVTPSGWVEEEVFYDWFINQFCPTVQHIKRPLILFFDGHRAHISARIVKTAMDNGIELECLPPHTTTLLQPLDVVTLHKVKTAWRTLLTEHNTKTNSAPIGKAKFSLMISDLWTNYVLKGHCSGGFSKAGIYPFDPRAVSKEKLIGPSSSSNTTNTSEDLTNMDDVPPMLISSSSYDQSSNIDPVHSTTATQTDGDQWILSANPTQTITMTTSSTIPADSSPGTSTITPTPSNLSLSTTATTTCAIFPLLPDAIDDSNSSNTPVFTDLTDQRITSLDHSVSTPRAPLDVLTNVINQYMTTSSTRTTENQRRQQVDRHQGESLTTEEVLTRLEEKEKAKKRKICAASKKNSTNGAPKKRGRPPKIAQQQTIGEIDQSSQLDQWGISDPTSSSLIIDQNLVIQQNSNNYSSVSANPPYHALLYQSQQPSQNRPSCYRCSVMLFGSFTNCTKCERLCCSMCVQAYFFSYPITCEYCALQTAISQVQHI